MKDRGERRLASGISVGNVQGTGIVIGHGSSASIKLHQSSVQEDAAAMLDEFIRLLEIHQISIADASDIHESAVAAKAEVAEPSPRWQIVRSLLRGIAAGVAGVSTLAEAINKIQALIAQIPT